MRSVRRTRASPATGLRRSLRKSGGEWDETDAGWWAFVDSDTQKRIEPHAWSSGEEEDE